MNLNLRETKTAKINRQIEDLLDELSYCDPRNEEYQTILENLDRLKKLKQGNRQKLSMDAILAAVVGLAQVGIIVHHEEFYSVTSKALGFVVKKRL